MTVRSGYSFRTAVGHLPDVIARLKAIGWKVAPICDRMSTFGFVEWTKLCAVAQLRPLYGVELGVVLALGERKPSPDYWRFMATDDLRALHAIIHTATSNPGKEPSLLYSQALAAEGVIKIAGPRCQLNEEMKNAKNLYFAISPATPKGLLKQALALGLRPIATSENFFPAKGDLEFYRVTLGWRASTQTYPQWILSDQEWHEATQWIADKKTRAVAIANRKKVFDFSKATLNKASLLKPVVSQTLQQMCVAGAKKKGINLHDLVYKNRLAHELNLIAEKKFEDYFFIIADLVGYAKQHMIVGPARGSSCGSLVCHLLDITDIDPIPFNLIFERFIDTTREDLPDIDLDFSDAKRQMVFDYAVKKYGRDRVARLGTVGYFAPRSALKGAGAALRIPGWRIEKVLDGVIERSSGDSRAMQQLEDTLNDTEAGRSLKEEFPEVLIAGRMEGHPNNASQHAAGIVITQEPVTNFVAVDARTHSAMCDKSDAEILNLLKIDALGLTQLSIFERCLELANIKGNFNIFLRNIPLNDPKAFEVLNKGHFSGIFQFTGGALRSLTKQFQVSEVEDLIAITALARPGPMASGNANAWVRRKTGRDPVSYPDKVFEPYLSPTLGCMIFQEQIMQIGREVGGLSWSEVSELRRAMSKSLGKEYFDKFGDKFKANAIKFHKVPAVVVDKAWDQLCEYGALGFNKAHAVAYGIVSYWCCYLKAHHPVEFAAATLDAESDPAKQIALLRELREEGVDYVPVDPDRSVDRWTIAKRSNKTILVGPLTQIKGIGPATVREILDARNQGVPIRDTLIKRLGQARTEIDTLFPIEDAIKKFCPDGLESIGIVSKPMPVIEVQCGVPGQVVIIGVARKIAPKDENEAVNVAKRGYALTGKTAALNLFFQDDTDEIFCKVNRFDFERLGRPILENGRAGKSIYAVKGQVPRGFRMISVKAVKYIGELS